MSDKQAYTDLIEHIENWLFGVPNPEELMSILEYRFTPEEAAFLSKLPHMPHSLDQLSERLRIPMDKLSEKMERGSLLLPGPSLLPHADARMERGRQRAESQASAHGQPLLRQ